MIRASGAYTPLLPADFNRQNERDAVHPYLRHPAYSATMDSYKVVLEPKPPSLPAPPQTLNARNMHMYMNYQGVAEPSIRSHTDSVQPPSYRMTSYQVEDAAAKDSDSNSSSNTIYEDEEVTDAATSRKRQKNRNKRKKAREKAKAKKQEEREKRMAELAKSQAPNAEAANPLPDIARPEHTSKPEPDITETETHHSKGPAPEDDFVADANPSLSLATNTEPEPDQKLQSENKLESEEKARQTVQAQEQVKGEAQQMVQTQDQAKLEQRLKHEKGSIEVKPEATLKSGEASESETSLKYDIQAETCKSKEPEKKPPQAEAKAQPTPKLQTDEKAQASKKAASNTLKDVETKLRSEQVVKSQPVKTHQHKVLGAIAEVQDESTLDAEPDTAKGPTSLTRGLSMEAAASSTLRGAVVGKADSRAGSDTCGPKTDDATLEAAKLLADMEFKTKIEIAVGCTISVDVYRHIREESGGDLQTAVNLYLNECPPDDFTTVSHQRNRGRGNRRSAEPLRSDARSVERRNVGPARRTVDARPALGPAKPFVQHSAQEVAQEAVSTTAGRGGPMPKHRALSYAAAASPSASRPPPSNQTTRQPLKVLSIKPVTMPTTNAVSQQEKPQQRPSSAAAEDPGRAVQLNPSFNSPLNQAASMQGKHSREKTSASKAPAKRAAVVPALPLIPPTTKQSNTTKAMKPASKPSMAASDAVGAPKTSISAAAEPSKAPNTAAIADADDKTAPSAPKMMISEHSKGQAAAIDAPDKAIAASLKLANPELPETSATAIDADGKATLSIQKAATTAGVVDKTAPNAPGIATSEIPKHPTAAIDAAEKTITTSELANSEFSKILATLNTGTTTQAQETTPVLKKTASGPSKASVGAPVIIANGSTPTAISKVVVPKRSQLAVPIQAEGASQSVGGSLAKSPTSSAIITSQRDGPSEAVDSLPNHSSHEDAAHINNFSQVPAGFAKNERAQRKLSNVQAPQGYELAKATANKDKLTVDSIMKELPELMMPRCQAAQDYHTMYSALRALPVAMGGGSSTQSAKTGPSQFTAPPAVQNRNGESAAKTQHSALVASIAASENTTDAGADTAAATPEAAHTATTAHDAQDEMGKATKNVKF